MTYECIVHRQTTSIIVIRMRNENKAWNVCVGECTCSRFIFILSTFKERFKFNLAKRRGNAVWNECWSFHSLLPQPSVRENTLFINTQNADIERRQGKEGCENILYTHIESFPTHTDIQRLVSMAMKKKSKPFGGRRQAKAFWGCVKRSSSVDLR